MFRLYQTAICRKGEVGKSILSENALAALPSLKEKIIISACAPTVGSNGLVQHGKPRDTVLHLAAKDPWLEELDLAHLQFGGKPDPRCKRHNRSRHAAKSHLPGPTLLACLREFMLSINSAWSREAPREPSAAISECVIPRVREPTSHRPPVSAMKTSATAAVSILLLGPMQRLFA